MNKSAAFRNSKQSFRGAGVLHFRGPDIALYCGFVWAYFVFVKQERPCYGMETRYSWEDEYEIDRLLRRARFPVFNTRLTYFVLRGRIRAEEM